jgi:acyl-CoA synthetase (AMP-forming)/AMP-acid ligase II
VNIAGILHEAARTSGDRTAIVDRAGAVTFAELDDLVAATAGELEAAGVADGMRALVLVPMSIALYAIVIALFRLRATAVFVDPAAGRARIDEAVRRVAPKAFVGVPRAHWLRLLSPGVRAIPRAFVSGGWAPGAVRLGRGRPDTRGSVASCEADTPAIITFTSGSTGRPKAVVRTHGFLVAQHRALAESLALAPGEIDLTTLPIFVFANLASGVTSVIPDADLRAPGKVDGRPILAQVRSRRVTRTVASPAFLLRVAEEALRAGETLDSLQYVFTGGAPVFPRTLDAIAAAAPEAYVVAVYGSTEAEPIAEIERRQIAPADREAMARGAGLLAGVPVPSIELRVVADRWGTRLAAQDAAEWDAQALAAGRVGEIVVSGDHVLRGYLDGIGDEDTKVRVGDRVWHRTGDAGYLDPAGRLWLLGRCSAKVGDTDGILYPFAVECAASDVGGVVRTAFTRVDDRRVLVVEGRGDREALREALATRLEWARLRDIVFVEAIPVDTRHNAKVDYPALARMLR